MTKAVVSKVMEYLELPDGSILPILQCDYFERDGNVIMASTLCRIELQRDNNMVFFSQQPMSHRCVESVLKAIEFHRKQEYGASENPIG